MLAATDDLLENHLHPVWLTSAATTECASAPIVIVRVHATLSARQQSRFSRALLVAEHANAEMEARWLSSADDLLVWIIVLDRLLTGPRFT